jgi:hypothetical protein
MIKKIVPKEFEEQEAVFNWAEIHEKRLPDLKYLNGSMNGAKRSWTTAIRAKRQGLKKGFPDISLPVPRCGYHGLYIELKRIKGGVVSKEQKEILNGLAENGYLACVCLGHEAAINVIEKYLKNKGI